MVKNNPKYPQKLFLRPVLIFKKLNRENFIGLPLTTKPKNGSWFYPILINQIDNRIVFSQIRNLDARRLKFSIHKITKQEFIDVQSQFIQFLTKK